MTRYAAFLRGVNVGGVNLKMAEVISALQNTGFDNVRTVLASGNVLLDSSDPTADVRTRAEAALRESFGYDAWVLVYDIDALRAIADDYPFPAEVDGHHSYVTFVSDPEILDELVALTPDAAASPREKIARGDSVLYWQVLRSHTLESTIGKTMGKKRYKSTTTTRNLRTVRKVLN